MGNKIILTTREKELIKKIIEPLSNNNYQEVIDVLSDESDNGDQVVHIIQFINQACSINILHCIEQISSCTFYINGTIQQITIPSNIKEIREYAFGQSGELTHICMQDGVELICEGAFYQCQKLSYVSFTNSVRAIGQSVFSQCSNLTELDFDGTEDDWYKIEKDDSWLEKSSLDVIHCLRDKVDIKQI